MSVLPVGEMSDDLPGAAKRGVWRRLAQAVETYCALRSQRMMPGATLRRSKREMNRCRRLVGKSAGPRIEDGVGSSRAAEFRT